MTLEWHRYGWAIAAAALLGCGAVAYDILGPWGLALVGAALLFFASRSELEGSKAVGEDGSTCLLPGTTSDRGRRTNAEQGLRARAETTAFLRGTSLAKSLGFAFLACAAALLLLVE